MKRTISRALRVATLGLASAVAATLLVSSPASAHDNLLDSSPAAGETVTSLNAVSLTFSGELIDFAQASFAQVVGPDGLYYETSCSTIEMDVLTTPVALGEPGTYTIIWNAVSSDGHPISEKYDFQYAPAADATPALGWNLPACRNESIRVQPGATPAAPPTAAATQTPAAQTPTPTSATVAASTNTDEGTIAFIIAGSAIALGVLLLTLVWLARRRRRRAS
ncbi:copper resistance CopC family protein [Microbacterium sp. MMO-10]|uniref:copper resistance CopC family protein n=1 Tax=Microbacterium sp. MMO-10 TaxID=3081272 RepID=UPI00301A1948